MSPEVASPSDRPPTSNPKRTLRSDADTEPPPPRLRSAPPGGLRDSFSAVPPGVDTGPESGNDGGPRELRVPPDEDSYVLQEIDRMQAELAPRRSRSSPTASPESDPSPEWAESPNDRDQSGEREGGEPSPYFEERLTIVRSVAAQLAEQARTVERSVRELRSSLETIDQELGRASSELGFVRALGWDDTGPHAGSWRAAAGLPGESTRPETDNLTVTAPSPSLAPIPRPTGSFQDFTVERYNRTVGELHDRRRAVGWGSVVAAVAISAVLLVVTLQAHEPLPPMWLAVLPVVWMVPVPFFVAAFRGTHRVLKENRLELREET